MCKINFIIYKIIKIWDENIDELKELKAQLKNVFKRNNFTLYTQLENIKWYFEIFFTALALIFFPWQKNLSDRSKFSIKQMLQN